MNATGSGSRRLMRLGVLLAVAVAVARLSRLDDALTRTTDGRPLDGARLLVPVLRSVLLYATGYIALVVVLAVASRLPVAGHWFGRMARVAGGASAGALTVRVLGVSLSLASMGPGPVAAEPASEPPVMRPVTPNEDSTASLETTARRAVLADRPAPDQRGDGAAPVGDAPMLRRTEAPSTPTPEGRGDEDPAARPAPRPTPPSTTPAHPRDPTGGDGRAVGPGPVDRSVTEVTAAAAAVHTVEAGESFWTIARDTMRASGRWDQDEVARYWVRLVEANRDRLVEPGNPDLIHVGQQLRLPR